MVAAAARLSENVMSLQAAKAIVAACVNEVGLLHPEVLNQVGMNLSLQVQHKDRPEIVLVVKDELGQPTTHLVRQVPFIASHRWPMMHSQMRRELRDVHRWGGFRHLTLVTVGFQAAPRRFES